MLEYTISKPPENHLDLHPIHRGHTKDGIGLRIIKMVCLSYILTHMRIKRKVDCLQPFLDAEPHNDLSGRKILCVEIDHL